MSKDIQIIHEIQQELGLEMKAVSEGDIREGLGDLRNPRCRYFASQTGEVQGLRLDAISPSSRVLDLMAQLEGLRVLLLPWIWAGDPTTVCQCAGEIRRELGASRKCG